MKITRAFILENRSTRNGWNFSQIVLLGEPWPPKRGWIDRAIGKELSDADAEKFIAWGKNRPSPKERRATREKLRAQRRQEQKVFRAKVSELNFALSGSRERGPRAPTKEQHLALCGLNAKHDSFLSSYEWRRVRMVVLKRDGARCSCCGATPADGVRVHVDHIKPRKFFPHLALDPNNLQVLCEACNHGKGNWDTTDWRGSADVVSLEEWQREHLKAIT